ncbi:Hpt domain-containing protein [Vibrio kasasachensis]|uniref:Hpt domain-containing protein n=1 Tax=Vibrio kasasachensis TaxID=2910248 RepID=UPI003D0FD6F5
MLDFNVIRALIDDDNDVMVALLSSYSDDYGDAAQKIVTLYQSQDWSELYMLSHSLKGTLKILGEESAAHILERIEHDTRDESPPIQEDIDAAKNELSAIQSQVQDYLTIGV